MSKLLSLASKYLCCGRSREKPDSIDIPDTKFQEVLENPDKNAHQKPSAKSSEIDIELDRPERRRRATGKKSDNGVDKNSTASTSTSTKKKKKTVKGWTKDEEQLLKKYHKQYKGKWSDVAKALGTKNSTQCMQKYNKLKPTKTKNPWNEEEDKKLLELVQTYGTNWQLISANIEGRTGKQVRDRYINNVDPSINKSPWVEEEDKIIVENYEKLGPKWSEISKFLRGRPENMIKNRFYSFIKKKLKVEKGHIIFDSSLYLDKYENNVDDASYVSSYKEDEEEELKDNDDDEPMDSSLAGDEEVNDSEEEDLRVAESKPRVQNDNHQKLVQQMSDSTSGAQQCFEEKDSKEKGEEAGMRLSGSKSGEPIQEEYMNNYYSYENQGFHINSKVPVEFGYYSEKKEDYFIFNGNNGVLDTPLINLESSKENYKKHENGLTLYPQDYQSGNANKYNSVGKQSNDSVDHINPDFFNIKNDEFDIDFDNKAGEGEIMGESGTGGTYNSNGNVNINGNYDSNYYEQFIANDIRQKEEKNQNNKMEIENF